jgi:hypothetical protein
MTNTPTVRTATGLVDKLFDAIDDLNAKRIDPEHARALSHTAKTIVAVAALEHQVQQAALAADGGEIRLRSLQIEAIAAE